MDKWMMAWPVAVFFLGGVATQFTGWLDYRRQRSDRAADDTAAIEQRREDFELAHLVECNELLRRTRSAVGEFAHATAQYAPHGDVRNEAYRQAFNDSARAFEVAESALSAQIGFIIDDDVRVLAGRMLDECTAAFNRILDSDHADTEVVGLHDVTANAYGALSARVRAIYAGQAVSAQRS